MDLVDINAEIARREKRFNLQYWYPDSTVHREPDNMVIDGIYHARHLYPRANEFWEAGNKFRYRLLDGANQCITPWTYVETDVGVVPSLIAFSLKDNRVVSWDGESEGVHQVHSGILKCIEPAFRFVMEDGSFFDCTSQHQVLTEQGYLSCDELVSLSNGLRYKHTVEDYEASCVEDGYLSGQRLQLEANTDPNVLPLPNDVQKRSLIFSREDAEERIHQCNLIEFPLSLRSTPGNGLQILDLYEEFSAAAVSQPILQLRDDTLTRKLSRSELFHLQSLSELNHDRAFFFPLEHPKLVGGKRIKVIVPLGWQPIVDATVNQVHNYKAAGVYHHNTGKTSVAGYEVALHVTGLYPKWWKGKRLNGPSKWWIAGETNRDVKEIMQDRFIGPVNERGTGLIPFHCLDFDSMTETDKADTFITTVYVRHFDENGNQDGVSVLTFKSYEAGRKSFQGLPRNVWMDEEPSLEILSECFARTTSNDELMLILTFTPLQGWSPMIKHWLPGGWPGVSGPVVVNGVETSRHLTIQTVDDVPHISKQKKSEMYENYHPHVREARLMGIPSMGSGAIFPIPQSEWVVPDFEIPKHYKKAYGMDVGWNWTALVFIAINPDDGTGYVYSESKKSETEPMGHAEIVRSRGLWIPGAIDTSANGRGADGGESLMSQYRALGLQIQNADKANKEANIYEVWTALKSGSLKVFLSCRETIKEIETYHRDEKGKIVKENDHLVDSLLYIWATRAIAKQQTPVGTGGRIDPRYINQFKR